MNVLQINRQEMTGTQKQFDTVVVGLGKTGASIVSYLIDRGESVAVVDTRDQPPEFDFLKEQYPEVPVFLGSYDKNILCNTKKLIVSPGVAIAEPAIQTAVSAGVELSSDVEIFCQTVDVPIVAVTGSNGKSTVVSILKEMVEQSGLGAGLAGNIGTPVLDIISLKKPDFYILELSSFQLETLQSLNAVAALVLNISADHMDRYENLPEYISAKQKIYEGNGHMIINTDDAQVIAMQEPNRNSISYGLSETDINDFGIRVINEHRWLCQGAKKLMPESELELKGKHNVSNALACLALGSAIKLPMENMLNVLRQFSGLPHRCQWVANIDGVDWYNDSKGTNVGASCAAIESLSENRTVILIAGGDGKHADFSPLAEVIASSVRLVILIGKDAGKIDQVLDDKSSRVFATSLKAAVNTAAKLATTGDLVLLSPSCASQDMFRDYQHRGESFCEAVNELQGRRL
jgi:UDP-N-acetylmuramoylalanine--D-glutamate ligase